MSLHLVKSVSYAGMSGVVQVRNLQAALNAALLREDWDAVRKLDQSCVVLIDKVIEANTEDGAVLAMALNELKGIYSSLIVKCKREVASMAH